MVILLVLVFLQPYMFITVQAQSRWDHANLYLIKPNAHQNSYKSSRTLPDASPKNFATDLQLYTTKRSYDFKLHNITIFVKDEAGNPVKGAFVKAFSPDWGRMYPRYEEWGVTDNMGSYRLALTTGNWVFFASSGWDYANMNPSKGFFIETTAYINNDTLIILKPQKSIVVQTVDEKGSPLSINELSVLSSKYIPAIPPAFVGYSMTGILTLYTNLENQNLTILAVKRPSSISDGYILVKEISTGDQAVNIISSMNTSKLILIGYDSNGSLSNYWHVVFRLPDLYLGGWAYGGFQLTGRTVFHITPMTVLFNPIYIPPGWYYYFDLIALSLEANHEYAYSFGRNASFINMWVMPRTWSTELWFNIKDEFGNVLAFYADSSSKPNITLRIFEGDKEVYKNNIKTLFYGIGRNFSSSATFKLDMNIGPLGGLGNLSIKGLLYDSKRLVKFIDLKSKNFDLHVPEEYFWTISGESRLQAFIDVLEKLYTSLGRFVGENLTVKPHKAEVRFFWTLSEGVGAAGIAGYNFVGIGLEIARWTIYTYPSVAGILAHELGHMYSFTPPLIYSVECPMYCEPLATYLGIEAIAYLYGPNFRLWYWGTQRGIIDYIAGDKSVSETERMQTVFSYLHKVYGPEIHKQFIQLWANNTTLKDKLMRKGFNVNETMITLYSYLAEENLAWLFQLAGYNVSDEKVNEGLKLILIETPSYIVNSIKSLWYDGTPGPILILDNQTIPIVSGDRNTIPIPSVVVVAREFGKGRVVASLGGFFTDKALNLFDNRVFARNVIEWLSRLNRSKILVSRGHSEWDFGPGFDEFRRMLENLGYNVKLYYGSLTPEILSNYDVLLIGTAWGNFTQEEISAILNFVNNGGGLLLTGLGWSWPPKNPTLDNYPMNIIGEHFGIRWIDSYIEDKDPQDNYNGSPIFHVFYPNIEIGTIPQAIALINNTLEKYGNNLPSILGSDPETRWKFFTANELLISATLNLGTNSSKRLELYNFYKQLFLSYPQLFRRNVTYDKNTENAMAWIRERSYFAFINTILLYSKGLTPQTVREIAETLGLSGKYLDIWMNFQVMILDNGMSSEKQLDFIYHYLSLIPRELHNLRFISIRDFLGALPDNATTISFPFSVAGFSRLTQQFGAVNVFSVEVGSVRENEFPEDVKPYETDVFSIVVAHEINHVVDAYYVSRNAILSERKNELIKRAGYNHMNYLRSMLPDGFFIQYPQEFFASIANEWFANTTHTLKLALVRFDKGYKEPLNQFIFFADVYSRGGKTTFFYTIDVEGNIQRKEILILRDDQDRIIGLVDGKTVYRFTLDSEGYVVSYFVSLDTTPPTTSHNYDGLWHTSDITIVLKGSDDLSGVAETFYRINSGPVKRVSVDGQPVISTEGANNTLEYWSIDNAGNEEPHKLLTGIKLDKTPPTGSITINEGRKYTNTTTVILALLASDKVSGVAEMRFSNDNITWTSWEPYSSTRTWILKPGDGLKYVYVQFRDHAGWISQTYYSTITLDTTPPTTSHNYDGLWHTSDITIVLSSSDNLSGVLEIYYRVNSGPVKRVSVDGQPVISTEGANNTLEYWSVDNAGNEEPHKMLTNIKLDKTPSLINIMGFQTRDSELTISWIGSDDLSGIDHYEIRLDEREWINMGMNTSYTFKDLAPGIHIIYIKAVDRAGNMNTTSIQLTITTVTQTTTIPTTTTTTVTSTTTMTQSTTVTQTMTVTTTATVTQTKVETYTTSYTITQTQSTATETAWMSTIVLVVILLLVGMLIGYAIKRR